MKRAGEPWGLERDVRLTLVPCYVFPEADH
jgi:hypothetical protein